MRHFVRYNTCRSVRAHLHFHADNLRQHVRSPLLVAEILAADERSLASRLSGGVRKLAGVAKRWSEGMSEVNFHSTSNKLG